jgi:hypothetical protein
MTKIMVTTYVDGTTGEVEVEGTSFWVGEQDELIVSAGAGGAFAAVFAKGHWVAAEKSD